MPCRHRSCHGITTPSSAGPGGKGDNSLRLRAIAAAKCGRKRLGRTTMAAAVNAGARLDRLPISGFHYRIFWLVGAGMFFDGYDLYVGTAVLPALLQSKFSTLAQNAQ